MVKNYYKRAIKRKFIFNIIVLIINIYCKPFIKVNLPRRTRRKREEHKG